MLKNLLLLTIGVCLVIACSSAPAQPDAVSEKKNRAADYLNFGQQYFQQGQYSQALQFFLIALDQNTAVDYAEGIGASYNSIGTTYLALGKPEEAEKALAEAEKIAKRISSQPLLLQTVNNQVQVEVSKGQFDDAFARLNAAGPQGFPETKEGAILYHALGVVEKNRGNLVTALVAFQKALEINGKLNLKQEMASNYFMIAALKNKQNDLKGAIEALSKALELDRTMENTVGIGQDLRVLGTLTAKLGDKETAYDYFVRSNRVFQAGSLPDEQIKTLDLLIALAGDMGKTADKAYYEKQKKQTLGQE